VTEAAYEHHQQHHPASGIYAFLITSLVSHNGFIHIRLRDMRSLQVEIGALLLLACSRPTGFNAFICLIKFAH